jgi:hypothetical protein
MTYSLFSSLFTRGFVGALWPPYWASEIPGRLGTSGSALKVRRHHAKSERTNAESPSAGGPATGIARTKRGGSCEAAG